MFKLMLHHRFEVKLNLIFLYIKPLKIELFNGVSTSFCNLLVESFVNICSIRISIIFSSYSFLYTFFFHYRFSWVLYNYLFLKVFCLLKCVNYQRIFIFDTIFTISEISQNVYKLVLWISLQIYIWTLNNKVYWYVMQIKQKLAKIILHFE